MFLKLSPRLETQKREHGFKSEQFSPCIAASGWVFVKEVGDE